MPRTVTAESKICKLEKELAYQKKLLKSARKLVTRINTRVVAVLCNQRHYLRARAPMVFKRQKELFKKATSLLKRMERIPRINFQTTHKRPGKNKRHIILMCTANEARKLRAMADLDFRQFNTFGRKKQRLSLHYSGK